MFKRALNNFINNARGAVTVFVTLLLIPAILISGSAVDLARIYTTRSSVQNGNQLAANSTLASYNALLKDLYGVYGYMADDPVLTSMMNEYIELTVFGKSRTLGMGFFQSFYGSENIDISATHSKPLNDPAVLKQQILEYMKFRGPVVLLQKLFDSLEGDAVKKLDADAEIIALKEKIDKQLEELFEMYKELYEEIQKADKCKEELTKDPYDKISNSFNSILNQFNTIENRNWQYGQKVEQLSRLKADLAAENAKGNDKNGDVVKSLEAQIKTTENEIAQLKKEYDAGIAEIKRLANSIETDANTIVKRAQDLRGSFDKIVTVAGKIDTAKAAVEADIKQLQALLDAGKCSDELKKGFTEPSEGGDERSLMQQYSDILTENCAQLARDYRDQGVKYCNDVITMFTPANLKFRNRLVTTTTSNSLTLDQLKRIDSEARFKIDLPHPGNNTSDPAGYNRAKYFSTFQNVGYTIADGFKKFGEVSTKHKNFYDELVKMAQGEDDGRFIELPGGKSGNQRGQIEDLKKFGDDYQEKEDDLKGARNIDDKEWDGKLSDSFDPLKLPKEVYKLISDPGRFVSDLVDYALILTYDLTAFSSYTTGKPVKTGEESKPVQSITGTEMSPAVNYFYQSEWEFLLCGNKNANTNHAIIVTLISTIRFVVNYIAVFNISEITTIVNLIKAIPIPFGINIILGELARLAFVIAETAMDVVRIRWGYKVAFYKSNDTWSTSPSGIARCSPKGYKLDDESGFTMNYENYMLVFLLGKAAVTSDPADTLVRRTAALMEWNTINYMYGVKASEDEMKKALARKDVFRLKNASTTVGITTTVDMRMIFLSMAMAQNSSTGIVPPRTLPVTVTDYRGY